MVELPSRSVIDGLWNENITHTNYSTKEQYYEHLFQQYKMCVEMADRISSRRSLANTFFLTLHTLLISGVGFVFEKGPTVTNVWLNIFPLVALLALCYSWWRIIQSYRQLNAAKYKVIGEFERRLPASPYWTAEWKALGEGKDRDLYSPLSDIENLVPIIFAFIYIVWFVAISFLGIKSTLG